jgi:putative colanic acid biosynthesis UDP-glucose lipid carrier transferase
MTTSATSDYGVDDAVPPADAERARWSRRVTIDIIAGLDTLSFLIGLCLSAAVHAREHGFAANALFAALELGLMSAAVAHFVLRQLGQYDEARIPDVSIRLGELLLAMFLVFATVQSVAFTLGAAQPFPRSWQPMGLAFGGLIMVTLRGLSRRVLRRYAASGRFDSNLAVYGAGRIARKLVDHAMTDGSGLQLVGVYDDRNDPFRIDAQGVAIAGGLSDLIEAGRADRIDEIIIALPQSADRRIADLVKQLEHLPVRIRVCTHIASDLLDARVSAHKVSNVGALGLLDVKSKPLADWAPFFKRLEDIVIGVPALIAFAPVMVLIAIAIKLDSKGPILFRQRRHGVNHHVFEVLKFRSMRVLEDGAVIRQASRNDARVTRVGKVLRRTSLDELPQLINIVLGDMSLVGPRPHALVHNEQYGEMLERYANRHQVKPGLTGWAQVNGYRGETQNPDEMRKRVELDLYYIDHWSLLFDLKILAATPFYGFAGKNAF